MSEEKYLLLALILIHGVLLVDTYKTRYWNALNRQSTLSQVSFTHDRKFLSLILFLFLFEQLLKIIFTCQFENLFIDQLKQIYL